MESKTITRWVQNWQFVGTDSNSHSVVMDSPKLGDNTGMKPSELLLIALAGCTGMDVISILQKKKVDVRDFEIRVSGNQSEEHPNAWISMHIEYFVRGYHIALADVERAVELSETKYCSVHATLKHGVTITRSIRIEEVSTPAEG